MKKLIRVVLVDDHAAVRRGIRRILEKDPNIVVVGDSSTGAGGIRLVHELQPDVLLLDIEMPDMKGYQVARELRACRLPVLILVLSSNDGNYFIDEIKQTGVDGFVRKSEAAATIQQAVYAITEKRSTLGMNPI